MEGKKKGTDRHTTSIQEMSREYLNVVHEILLRLLKVLRCIWSFCGNNF